MKNNNFTFQGHSISGETFVEGFYVLLRDSVQCEVRWSLVSDMAELVGLTKRGCHVQFIEIADVS